MSNTTTKTTAIAVANEKQQAIDCFGTIAGFEAGQRIATMFSKSNLVPANFKGDIGGCLIALNMAQRMQADPLQVMQSLYVVHGKPSFSSAFLIACFNQCGRFSAIRYNFTGERGSDDWGCQAVTTEKATGEVIEGVTITIGMAKAEGWYGKAGSKWKTMPELMLRYRAAAFLIRTVAPELTLGFQTTEEVRDVIDITAQAEVTNAPTSLAEIAETQVLSESAEPAQAEDTTENTAEIAPDEQKTANDSATLFDE